MIQAVRPAMVAEGTEWENKIVTEHFYYLKDQTEKGIFSVVGRTLNTDNSTIGIGILRAKSDDEAWQIAEHDPAVINRVMRLDVLPFKVLMVKAENETA